MNSRMWKKLWFEEEGFVLSSEIVMVGSALVLGSAVGLTGLRDAVNTELADLAEALGSIDQSFCFSGVAGHHAFTAGSIYIDQKDCVDQRLAAAPRERIVTCADVFGYTLPPPPNVGAANPAAANPVPPAPANPAPAAIAPPLAAPPRAVATAPQPAPAPVVPQPRLHVVPQQGYAYSKGVTVAAPICGQLGCRTCGPAPAYGYGHGHARLGYGQPEGSIISFPPPGAQYGVGYGAIGGHHAPHAMHPHHGAVGQPGAQRVAATTLPLPNDGNLIKVINGTNDELKRIAALKNTRALCISGLQITDDGIAALADLKHLQTLYLIQTSVTDGVFVHLLNLPALRELHIIECSVSDAGLVPARSLKQLALFELQGTRVTEVGLHRLQQALPEVQLIVK